MAGTSVTACVGGTLAKNPGVTVVGGVLPRFRHWRKHSDLQLCWLANLLLSCGSLIPGRPEKKTG